MHMVIGGGLIRTVVVTVLFGVAPVSAQQAETSGDQSPALIAGRDAIVNYGLTPEQVRSILPGAAIVQRMIARENSALPREAEPAVTFRVDKQ